MQWKNMPHFFYYNMPQVDFKTRYQHNSFSSVILAREAKKCRGNTGYAFFKES